MSSIKYSKNKILLEVINSKGINSNISISLNHLMRLINIMKNLNGTTVEKDIA